MIMQGLICYYNYLVRFLNSIQHIFLLFIHLYWGYLFFIVGTGKFDHIDHVVLFFESLEVGAPVFNAYLVATIETVGGVLIFFGLFTRIAAIFTTGTMIGASIFAHAMEYGSMLSDPASFYMSPNFSFLAASLIMLLFGPGLVSIDGIIRGIIKKRKESSPPPIR